MLGIYFLDEDNEVDVPFHDHIPMEHVTPVITTTQSLTSKSTMYPLITETHSKVMTERRSTVRMKQSSFPSSDFTCVTPTQIQSSSLNNSQATTTQSMSTSAYLPSLPITLDTYNSPPSVTSICMMSVYTNPGVSTSLTPLNVTSHPLQRSRYSHPYSVTLTVSASQSTPIATTRPIWTTARPLQTTSTPLQTTTRPLQTTTRPLWPTTGGDTLQNVPKTVQTTHPIIQPSPVYSSSLTFILPSEAGAIPDSHTELVS